MTSDLATLVLRAWADVAALNIQRLVHRSPDVAWDTITSHLIFVLRHPAVPPRRSPSVCRLRAPSIAFSSSSHATSALHPAISKRQYSRYSRAFSTYSRSRSCSLAPPRAPTWTYVAWVSKLYPIGVGSHPTCRVGNYLPGAW